MSGVIAVSYFLLDLIINLLLAVFWIRIVLRYFGVSHRHPVGEVVYKLTDPIVCSLENILHIPKTIAFRHYDWITFGLIITVEAIKFILIPLLFAGIVLPLFYLLLSVIIDTIIQVFNLLFYALLIRIIMSWINPGLCNPILDIIRLATDPLLRIIRRTIPHIIGNFDFAPLLLLIMLKVFGLFFSALLPYHIY